MCFYVIGVTIQKTIMKSKDFEKKIKMPSDH